jgi:Na+/H+ antiporter NhaC
MGILCPAVVPIAAGLLEGHPAGEATEVFYGAIGAVLAGAVFGDHCSPISDTTVLSSLATQCSLEQHVWTQMPYAVVVALVSMLCGDVLCQYVGLSPWLGLLLGAALLWVIVRVVGQPTPEHAAVQPGQT